MKLPNFRDTYMLLLRIGPGAVCPCPSSLRTHQERGPLRCGRCRAHTAPPILILVMKFGMLTHPDIDLLLD
jgi:hypothetical protein